MIIFEKIYRLNRIKIHTNAPNCNILKKFSGGMPPDPPSKAQISKFEKKILAPPSQILATPLYYCMWSLGKYTVVLTESKQLTSHHRKWNVYLKTMTDLGKINMQFLSCLTNIIQLQNVQDYDMLMI